MASCPGFKPPRAFQIREKEERLAAQRQEERRERARQEREKDIAHVLDVASTCWCEITPRSNSPRDLSFFDYRVAYIVQAAKEMDGWFHWIPFDLNAECPVFSIIKIEALAKIRLRECKAGRIVTFNCPRLTGNEGLDRLNYDKWVALVKATIDYAKIESANAGKRLFTWNKDWRYCIQFTIQVSVKQTAAAAA